MQTFLALLTSQPVLFIHLAFAIAALLLGAVQLLRRKGTPGHRVLGWAWVLLMACTAVSALFISDHTLPNIAGITPLHLLVVVVAVTLPRGIWHIRHGNVVGHQHAMRNLYLGACVVAGLFTLLPGRFLGHWLWAQTFGVSG